MKVIRRLSFLVISLGLLVMAGCSDDDPVKPPERWQTPNFVLKDLEGEEFQLSAYQEYVVLLQFFAAWCATCQTETAVLNKLNSDLKDQGLVVVGIVVVNDRVIEEVQAFADIYKVNYRILLDEVLPAGTTVAEAYGVGSVPNTVIVDREGWIDERQFAGFLSEEELLAIIGPLL